MAKSKLLRMHNVRIVVESLEEVGCRLLFKTYKQWL